MKNSKKTLKGTALLTGVLVTGSLSLNASAATELMNYSDLGSGVDIRTSLLEKNLQSDLPDAVDAIKYAELKCGEGKCGEGKCGEGTDKEKDDKTKGSKTEAKAEKGTKAQTEAKAEAKTDKTSEAKCGEGTCGSGDGEKKKK